MAIKTLSRSLNVNAPLFVPAAFVATEDFSPQWWHLIKTSPAFGDYWLRERFVLVEGEEEIEGEGEGEGEKDEDEDDDYSFEELDGLSDFDEILAIEMEMEMEMELEMILAEDAEKANQIYEAEYDFSLSSAHQ